LAKACYVLAEPLNKKYICSAARPEAQNDLTAFAQPRIVMGNFSDTLQADNSD
jgi:hypothetical protein